MYRIPHPLNEESLNRLMADDRYWRDNHPEHAAYQEFVTEAFKHYYGTQQVSATPHVHAAVDMETGQVRVEGEGPAERGQIANRLGLNGPA
ncbi:hypothetical protein [Magnetospira sp. QH-2]|uniref:hypothetical protein n=1 Tax=Magnetospira sp. (strain QH-2) TaxID=1288970 RepID=UPI0003E80EF1|nr:hypothetical protein [Magnetospira sp. QH-2]CCQ72343.1 protein of unknown function [Magnetospira sp. QH-2]